MGGRSLGELARENAHSKPGLEVGDGGPEAGRCIHKMIERGRYGIVRTRTFARHQISQRNCAAS
jgi:hypothetical protein